MKLAVLLLLWSGVASAGWTFESYGDGFKTFKDGVEQYEQKPTEEISYQAVDISDSGYVAGNAVIEGQDLMMFVLDQKGDMEMGLWTGEAQGFTGNNLCARMGWGYKLTTIDVTTHEMSSGCGVETTAVPEPGILALLTFLPMLRFGRRKAR